MNRQPFTDNSAVRFLVGAMSGLLAVLVLISLAAVAQAATLTFGSGCDGTEITRAPHAFLALLVLGAMMATRRKTCR